MRALQWRHSEVRRDAVLFPVAVADGVRPVSAADLGRRGLSGSLQAAARFGLFERAARLGRQHRGSRFVIWRRVQLWPRSGSWQSSRNAYGTGDRGPALALVHRPLYKLSGTIYMLGRVKRAARRAPGV